MPKTLQKKVAISIKAVLLSIVIKAAAGSIVIQAATTPCCS
jgi:hypothetical protein